MDLISLPLFDHIFSLQYDTLKITIKNLINLKRARFLFLHKLLLLYPYLAISMKVQMALQFHNLHLNEYGYIKKNQNLIHTF